MTLREDKTKVLEMICSKILPVDLSDDVQEVSLNEEDFKRMALTFESVSLIIKQIYDRHFITSTSMQESERGMIITLKVTPDIENYLLQFKYPETEYEEFDEYGESKSAVLSKDTIVIDDRKGIYREANQKLCYPLKSGSKRNTIVFYLLHNDKASISELEKETDQSSTLVVKEIKAINATFRKKLNLAYDLIIRFDTGGYSLNRDKFEIKTPA